MDPLVEIAKSDLAKLRDNYGTIWPYGVDGYCLLDSHLSQPELTEIYNFKFYCPYGEIKHGMVAIGDKKHYYEFLVCPISTTGLKAIENALAETNLVDWSREMTVASANIDVLQCMKRIRGKLALKIVFESKAYKYLLNKDAKPFDVSHLPNDTYVGPLKPEFLDLVNRTWTFYSGEHSYENFKALMEQGRTFVLYSTIDHKPLSWITIDDSGAFTHLYCVEEHRRKGYSEYITKIASNSLLTQGKNVLAYTLEENLRPQSLFNKLGFDLVGEVWWVCLTKDK